MNRSAASAVFVAATLLVLAPIGGFDRTTNNRYGELSTGAGERCYLNFVRNRLHALMRSPLAGWTRPENERSLKKR